MVFGGKSLAVCPANRLGARPAEMRLLPEQRARVR
jgi:hypothetical protein